MSVVGILFRLARLIMPYLDSWNSGHVGRPMSRAQRFERFSDVQSVIGSQFGSHLPGRFQRI